jgi:hypothetical protein
VNPFDYETQADPDEKSSHSPADGGPDAQGKGREPEDSDGPPTVPSDVADRIARLERKLDGSEEKIIDLIAQNAELRSQAKQGETTETKAEKHTKEQLKQFGLQEGGKQQFDAATFYADQVVAEAKEEIKTELRQEYRQGESQKFVQEYMLEVYPDLKNPNSDFSKKVNAEQARLLSKGVVDVDSPDARTHAYSLALHRVGRTVGTTKVERAAGETDAEFSSRRRHEASAAEGAPSGETTTHPEKASKSEKQLLKTMLGKDPSKESVAMFKRLQSEYAGMRVK